MKYTEDYLGIGRFNLMGFGKAARWTDCRMGDSTAGRWVWRDFQGRRDMSGRLILSVLALGILAVVLGAPGCRRDASRGRVAFNDRRVSPGRNVKPAEVMAAVAYRPAASPVSAPMPAGAAPSAYPVRDQSVPVPVPASQAGPVYSLSAYEAPRDLPLIQPTPVLAAAQADLTPVRIQPPVPAFKAGPAIPAPIPELGPDRYVSGSSFSRLGETTALTAKTISDSERREIQRVLSPLTPLAWQPAPIQPLPEFTRSEYYCQELVASPVTAMRGSF